MLSAVHHVLNSVSERQYADALPINFCLQESDPHSVWMFILYQGMFYSYTVLFREWENTGQFNSRYGVSHEVSVALYVGKL